VCDAYPLTCRDVAAYATGAVYVRGAAAEVSTSLRPPAPRKAKVIVPFRCDPENATWLQGFTSKPKPTISEVADWAVALGRLHYDALHQFDGRVSEIARAEGISEKDALAKVFRLGLEAYEKKKR
jgi:hypothetical protein